jgi:MFS family permease
VLDRDVGGLVASLKAPVAVFRNPDLRRLEPAWAAMSFATWSFAIALAVYAYDAAGAAAVGLVALLRLLPGAVAAPFAGLLGDTHSRRKVLVTSFAATAVVLAAATVAAATGRAPAIVFCTAAGFAVAMAAYPPVESALLPQLARTPQELSAANVALSAMDNAGFLVGAIAACLLCAFQFFLEGGRRLPISLSAEARVSRAGAVGWSSTRSRSSCRRAQPICSRIAGTTRQWAPGRCAGPSSS